jgi:hypothetical protein
MQMSKVGGPGCREAGREILDQEVLYLMPPDALD